MSGQQKTMFGGRNKKRAKKRQERGRQQNKHRRERKAREQVRLANAVEDEGAEGSGAGSGSGSGSGSSSSSVAAHNQRRAATEAAVAAVLKAKGYAEADAGDGTPPESKMSRTKRKKLARLASDREKKKHRSELFAQLAANALSAQQQSMLQSTATLGQKQTMRQRLKSDLMKQRAGMEIDEASSRLEVRMMPVVASDSNSAGKWSAPGSVAPPRQVVRPFGVSSFTTFVQTRSGFHLNTWTTGILCRSIFWSRLTLTEILLGLGVCVCQYLTISSNYPSTN